MCISGLSQTNKILVRKTSSECMFNVLIKNIEFYVIAIGYIPFNTSNALLSIN
jgi:hypothetical protein